MQITVQCPACNTALHLNDDMRGRKVRCPNVMCRDVIAVPNGSEPPADPTGGKPAANGPSNAVPPAKKGYVSGHIGELVPFVTSEAAEEPAPIAELPAAPVSDATSWKEAPPPIRRSGTESAPASEPAKPKVAPVTEPPAWQQPPSPIRGTSSPSVAPTPPAEPTPSWQAGPPPVRRSGEIKQPIPPIVSPPIEIVSASVEPPPVRPTAKPAEPPPIRSPKKKKPEPEREAAQPPYESVGAKNGLLAETKPANPSAKEGPREVGPGAWEAPPVRRGETEAAPDTATDWSAPAETLVTEPLPLVAPAKRSAARWAIMGLLTVCVAAGAFVYMVVGNPWEVKEEGLWEKGKAAYDEKRLPEARNDFNKLIKNFPDRERLATYVDFRDFIDVRIDAESPLDDPDNGVKKLRTFLGDAKHAGFVRDYKSDIWGVFVNLLERMLDKLESMVEEKRKEQFQVALDKQIDPLDQLLKKINELRNEGKPFNPTGDAPSALTERIAKAKKQIDRLKDLETLVAKLKTTEPTPKAIEDAEDKLIAPSPFREHPRLRVVRAELWDKAARSVVYVPTPPIANPPTEDNIPGILVDPAIGEKGQPGSGQGIVFALARGVLYALQEKTGQIAWARRVGIDTAILPIRLPPTEANQAEVALVFSSDNNTLTARTVAKGNELWKYWLQSPCLGRPVLVDRKVYVPTLDGWIHEIDVGSGHVFGKYHVETTLRVGGTRQAGSNLLYFPADKDHVYVIDTAAKKCIALLDTKHPAGSLRGEPIIIPQPQGNNPNAPPQFLVLSQTDGLDRMRLRVWEVHADWSITEPENVKPIQLPGWSWFEPYVDVEKIGVVTEAGVLGLYGIKQPGNLDPALFPLFGENGQVRLRNGSKAPSRAQVVHAYENDFWLLSQGELRHCRLGIDSVAGEKVGAVWEKSVPLGSPLHAGQVNETQDTLFTVTQPADGLNVLATAIDAKSSDIRWQRQLGLNCAGDLLALGGRVLAKDKTGALFLFDSAKMASKEGDDWFIRSNLLAPAPPEHVNGKSYFIPGSNNTTASIVTRHGRNEMLIRRYGVNPKTSEGEIKDFPVRGSLGGTPALVDDQLFFPMANGQLGRLQLGKDTTPNPGPAWRRAENADFGAHGHVVHLTGSDFLFTDGSSKLYRLSWPSVSNYKEKPLKLPPVERIVSAPLVLPNGNNPPRVCVADSTGTVTLLKGEHLEMDRSWKLPGAITTGPFRWGDLIACVVDGRSLVCLDPSKAEPAWEYTSEMDGGIVGQPQLIGKDRVIVAHLGGRLRSLDPATGQPHGPGYQIKASVAPTESPVPFGEDRLFAPLTDGTMMLVPLAEVAK